LIPIRPIENYAYPIDLSPDVNSNFSEPRDLSLTMNWLDATEKLF